MFKKIQRQRKVTMLKCMIAVTGACALSLIAPREASAGEKLGRITSVHLGQQHAEKVFVRIEGAYTQPEPACSLGVSSWDFVLNISGPTGKAIYTQLMAAQYSQTPVLVAGSGDCTLHAGYETLQYIIIDA